jgi:hypothetical protein
MANLGSNFYTKLVQMTTELGMKPEDLLAIMVSESGINPSAGKGGGASGLIQFMPETLHGAGFQGDQDQFRQLSGEDQIPFIKKYIQGAMSKNGGPFTSAAQYYVANFWPVALKLPGVRQGNLDTAIVEYNPVRHGAYSKKYLDIGIKIPAIQESRAYKANPLFDKDKKGSITYGDMVHQVEINKRSPIYQRALANMQAATGYRASHVPSQMATKIKKHPSPQTGLQGLLDHFLEMVNMASPRLNKKLYKEALPNHDILIEIKAPDYSSSIEFSRILCSALDEELLSTSYPHTDGHLVEVECCIPGPAKDCFATVKQLTEAIAETFKDATIKIGGITVETNCIMNKKSSYQSISLKTADTNYRTFLLKFI